MSLFELGLARGAWGAPPTGSVGSVDSVDWSGVSSTCSSGRGSISHLSRDLARTKRSVSSTNKIQSVVSHRVQSRDSPSNLCVVSCCVVLVTCWSCDQMQKVEGIIKT